MGLIDQRIKMIRESRNPFFVAELKTGYVVMGDHQRFRGYTLFLSKSPVTELHMLPDSEKQEFLNEMSLVSEAVFKAFSPDKLNYELLGNGDPHMHWHIFPRYEDDGVRGPVWWLPFEEMKVIIPEAEMEQLKRKLLEKLMEDSKIKNHLITSFLDDKHEK